MWYVVQVTTGREQAMCEKVRRAAAALAAERGMAAQEVLKECFSPRYRTMARRAGGWEPDEQALLPGYLIAVTGRPELLAQALRRAPDFARVLGNDDAFTPLDDDEAAWIDAFSSGRRRVVPMSEGFKEGGIVHVTSGPLVGYEGAITKVDRRKHVAYLQLEVMGRKKEVKVGFNLVRKAR